MALDETFLIRRSIDMIEESPEAAKEAFHEAAKANMEPCPSCGKRIRHRKGLNWCKDHEMTERQLQDRVVDRAKRRGWTVAHAGKGWVGDQETGAGQFVTPMMPGWPDLFLMNPKMRGHKVFAAELKREDGVVDPKQTHVLALLNACGIPAVVLRPSDLREGRVNAILEGK